MPWTRRPSKGGILMSHSIRRTSLSSLGTVLDTSWSHFGKTFSLKPPWRHIGPSCRPSWDQNSDPFESLCSEKDSRCFRGRSWNHTMVPIVHLRAIWKHLEAISIQFWKRLGSIWGTSWLQTTFEAQWQFYCFILEQNHFEHLVLEGCNSETKMIPLVMRTTSPIRMWGCNSANLKNM